MRNTTITRTAVILLALIHSHALTESVQQSHAKHQHLSANAVNRAHQIAAQFALPVDKKKQKNPQTTIYVWKENGKLSYHRTAPEESAATALPFGNFFDGFRSRVGLRTVEGPKLFGTLTADSRLFSHKIGHASLWEFLNKWYPAAVLAASKYQEVTPQLLFAVAWQESRLNSVALSHASARGGMQFIAATARWAGITNRNDVEDSMLGAAKLLAHLANRYRDVRLVLAAYNAGEGAVNRHKGVPPFAETQHYVTTVYNHLQRMDHDNN